MIDVDYVVELISNPCMYTCLLNIHLYLLNIVFFNKLIALFCYIIVNFFKNKAACEKHLGNSSKPSKKKKMYLCRSCLTCKRTLTAFTLIIQSWSCICWNKLCTYFRLIAVHASVSELKKTTLSYVHSRVIIFL